MSSNTTEKPYTLTTNNGKYHSNKIKSLLTIITIMSVLSLICFTYWRNVYLLKECDFKSPWVCETIHAIGLIPPLNLVTVSMSEEK